MNGTRSDTCPVTSGVPQGSVLGPVLFLIMISDINKDILQAITSVFADDTKVKLALKTLLDCEVLQSDLNIVYDWGDTNNLKFLSLSLSLL